MRLVLALRLRVQTLLLMGLIDESQLSFESQSTLRLLSHALPEREWKAVECWLTTFYDFQLEWLLDWGRFALLNKSRQIGASHTYGAAAVLWGLFGEKSTIVSVGEREGLIVLGHVNGHVNMLTSLGSRWAAPVRKTRLDIDFTSGGHIEVLPSTSAARGFSGNVLLDEFAYHEAPEKVWDSASGAVLHAGRMRVMSTPNGVGNLWHTLFTDPDQHRGYRLHQTTLEQAIASGMRVNKDDCMKQARGDMRVYDQLFNCSFLGGEFQYIPNEAVNACSTDNLYTFDGHYYAGLDIGRNADKTVLIVVRKDPHTGLRTLAHVDAFKRTDYALLQQIVQQAFARFRIKRLCVDSTGIGSFPVEQMQKKHGRSRVEAVHFTLQSKEELATGLYSAFTERTVRIPKTDEAIKGLQAGVADQLRQDICSIRRETTKAGNVRYDAPHTQKGHADSAWALALALHASGGPNRQRHTVNLIGGPETLY